MKGRYRNTLEAQFTDVLGLLAQDLPLAERHRDHPLAGSWAGFRDCHVKPDLVLIYEKPDATTLRLVRIGSHSELGL
jgi:mRNA interferase YafQ